MGRSTRVPLGFFTCALCEVSTALQQTMILTLRDYKDRDGRGGQRLEGELISREALVRGSQAALEL